MNGKTFLLFVFAWARIAVAIPSGGLFGGPARSNGSSINWNPAAVADLGEAYAGLVELNGIAILGHFERAGLDPNTNAAYKPADFFALSPNLSFTLVFPGPVSWLRFIVGGFSPLALAANWPDDGAGRYHATQSMIVTYGAPIGVVLAPNENWGLSFAIGPMFGILDSAYHLDFGAFANGQLPPGSQPMPLENPQLEGRVKLDATGWDALIVAGVWGRPVKPLRFGFGLVRPLGMTLHGKAKIKSSAALDQALPGFKIDSEGDLDVSYRMSFQLQAEVEWRPGDWSVAAIWQDQYSHVRATVPATISNSTVAFLNGDQTSVGDTRDELCWGVRVSRMVGEDWEIGVRGDWLPTSIPSETINPGNMDYDMIEVTAGARWRYGDASLIEFSYMYAHGLDQHVTNSIYNPYAPPDSGLASPSGNGLYQVDAHMLTVTWMGVSPASPTRR